MAKNQKNDKEKQANNFVKELKSELKKVTWPTFKGLVNNTSAVIAIVLIVAVIVFVLDVCFENLNNLGVGGIKSLVSSENSDENSDAEESEEESDGSIDLTDAINDGIEVVPEESGDVQEDNVETDSTVVEENPEVNSSEEVVE